MTENEKTKITGFDIVAIISGLGIIGWIISDFFGGMVLILVAYAIFVIPIVLLYIFSFFDTTISLIRKGKQTSKIKLTVHLFVILTIIFFNLFHSDIFKSRRIMTAILKDDLYHYRLIFRENGDVENQINGAFGFSKKYYGKYKIEKGLIIFSKKPYDNNFIPDTLLLDKEQNAIFLNKDKSGQFTNKKEWLNHFEIE